MYPRMVTSKYRQPLSLRLRSSGSTSRMDKNNWTGGRERQAGGISGEEEEKGEAMVLTD